jgi:hypothetical protein
MILTCKLLMIPTKSGGVIWLCTPLADAARVIPSSNLGQTMFSLVRCFCFLTLFSFVLILFHTDPSKYRAKSLADILRCLSHLYLACLFNVSGISWCVFSAAAKGQKPFWRLNAFHRSRVYSLLRNLGRGLFFFCLNVFHEKCYRELQSYNV